MTNFESEFGGKVAIVTGGAGSIGRAIAEALAGYGAEVHVFDRDRDAMQACVQSRSRPGAIKAHVVDVAKSTEVEQGVAHVVAGGHEISILFNNAGIEDTQNHSLIDLGETLWDEIMDTNLKGAFLMTKAVLPSMLRGGSGRIVNVASSLGMEAQAGKSAYNASKAGLIMLTRTTALEFGDRGIVVNALCPGAIMDTAMHQEELGSATDRAATETLFNATRPMKRHGLVREVVPAALFLASSSASYMTGSTVTIDGGRTAGLSPHLRG